jgi:hypothetical protein
MNNSTAFSRMLLCCAIVAALTTNASAYIDAGTGSVITQVLIAGTLGALFMLKNFWNTLRKAIQRRGHNHDVSINGR